MKSKVIGWNINQRSGMGKGIPQFVIDELIGQQEIVIKSLGKYIKQCKFISGATILGDGEVALILDANALL